jgi:DNA mismatch repair protein MutL
MSATEGDQTPAGSERRLERRPVRRLDPSVVAKIAAGEMILRPFSAVKELVENALDAGAGAITVTLSETPDAMLRVDDDGCGMDRDDLLLALEAHATSKLSGEDDLLHITTLGFRGEALPSIGRVSRMEIVTASAEGAGWWVRVEGGDRRGPEPAARARGTSVTVEDLFFNSPVRKRFLKGPDGEVRLILRLMAVLGLACPGVAFRLISRGQVLLDLPVAQDIEERIAGVHGPSFPGKLLPMAALTPAAALRGFVGIPELARPGTQHQTLLVNGRWVTAPWLSAALRQGFGDLLPANRNAFALVALDIDPSRVDVNVHPTKREIRFLDESALFGAVVRAVREATATLVPGWNLDPADPGTAAPIGDRPGVGGGLWPGSGPQRGPGSDHGIEPGGVQGGPGLQESLFGGARSRMDGRRALELLYGGPDHPGLAGSSSGTVVEGSGSGLAEETIGPGTGVPLVRDDRFASVAKYGTAGVGESTGEAEGDAAGTAGRDTADVPDSGETGLAPIWQLHRRYLFAQTRQGLLVVDQHAAHERVLYERALDHLRGMPAASQQLLFPVVIELDPDEMASWREFARDLGTLGLEGEEFGGRSVLLRGVPAVWGRDPETLFHDLLHELSGAGRRGRDRAERLAAAWACRSAVRSGQPLSLEEMNALVDQLFATRMPHGDPHGRPTFLLVTLEDLDRRFGRSG